jgi:hypothetical protein
MFRKYGYAGIALLLVGMQPLAQWYFPLVWFGYILLADAAVYKLRKHSLIMSKPLVFVALLPLSALVWWAFEFLGHVTGNWYYGGLEGFGSGFWVLVFGTVSFATVIPAVFETSMLVRCFHGLDRLRLRASRNVSKSLLYGMILMGLASLLLTLGWPGYFFPLVWLAFFLILDPINYLHRQPSMISHLSDRKLAVPLAVFLGATVCGFFWEFWNYWAIPKWYYTIPFVGFWKVFEMPVLGYLGYGPFGWELYAMYSFVLSLRRHRKDDHIFLMIGKKE